MLYILEALLIDALEDAGYFGFQFCRIFDFGGELVVGERGESSVEDERVWIFGPGAAFEAEEVAKKGVAAFGEDALGVVLDGFESELAMANAHDDTAFLGDTCDHQFLGEGLEGGTERVVASREDALGYAFEATSAVMSDGAELAVFDLACVAAVG